MESNRWEKYDIDWQPQTDGNYPEDMDPMEKILTFDNVLVLYCSAGVKDDGYTRDYDLSEGTGLYLNGPTCRMIRWKKDGVTGGFTIYDQDGNTLMDLYAIPFIYRINTNNTYDLYINVPTTRTKYINRLAGTLRENGTSIV